MEFATIISGEENNANIAKRGRDSLPNVEVAKRSRADEPSIDRKLSDLGMRRVANGADGNCLFYSTAYACGLTDERSSVRWSNRLRARAAAVLIGEHGPHWREAMGIADSLFDGEWQERIENVRIDGRYAKYRIAWVLLESADGRSRMFWVGVWVVGTLAMSRLGPWPRN